MTEFSMTWVAVKVVPPPVRSTVNNELEHEPAKMKYMMPKRVPAATIWPSEAIVQSTTAPGSKFRVMSDPIPSPSSLYISTDPVLKQKTCWDELSYEHPFTLRSLPPLSVTLAAQASGSNVAVSMTGDVAVGVHGSHRDAIHEELRWCVVCRAASPTGRPYSAVRVLPSSQTAVVKVLATKSHERMVEYEFVPPASTTTWATGFVAQSQTPASTSGKRGCNNKNSHMNRGTFLIAVLPDG